MIRRP